MRPNRSSGLRRPRTAPRRRAITLCLSPCRSLFIPVLYSLKSVRYLYLFRRCEEMPEGAALLIAPTGQSSSHAVGSSGSRWAQRVHFSIKPSWPNCGAPKGHAFRHSAHPIQRLLLTRVLPLSPVSIAPTGQATAHKGVVQCLQLMGVKRNNHVPSPLVSSCSTTSIHLGPTPMLFSILQAVSQAWHPTHRSLSTYSIRGPLTSAPPLS